ncbi:hypothetical protein DH09_10160 [Bacillaceae bacterium JMAK1]|nr:hypothetical protein DH09_10160 [Bacillaceae bacterium JMAK1]
MYNSDRSLRAMKVACVVKVRSRDGKSDNYTEDTSNGEESDQGTNDDSSSDTGHNNDNIIQISDAEGLNAIRENLEGHYKLTSDIDLSDYGNWVPIGSDNDKFTGTIDGGGYTVNGMTINKTRYAGFISHLDHEGVVKNLNFDESTINGRYYVGTVSGSSHGGEISNVSVNGKVKGIEYVGGFVGSSYESTLTNSNFSGEIIGNRFVGGAIAESTFDLISDVKTDVILEATHFYIGGVLGYASNSNVVDSSSHGTILGDGHIGGLIGSSTRGLISHSYSGATISGVSHLGGLVGFLQSKLSNSYSYGDVIAEGYSGQVGGLVGELYEDSNFSGTIDHSYSASSVTGRTNTHGLVGYIDNSVLRENVINSYYIENQLDNNEVGIPLSESEMANSTYFYNWDFENTWTFNSYSEYLFPVLRK